MFYVIIKISLEYEYIILSVINHFWNHMYFYLSLSVNFFILKLLKEPTDEKNITLRNLKEEEFNRLLVDSLKMLVFQFKRFIIYLFKRRGGVLWIKIFYHLSRVINILL